MSTAIQLITKYRPENFDEILGHDTQIKALQNALTSPSPPHNFLLTGPSGVGKTTTARIIASVTNSEILECDAGQHSGVDDVRQIIDSVQSFSFQNDGNRFVIIDECQSLSKQAFQSLLKIMEDPPVHLYFALCTTDPAKVPDTIRSRCFSVQLRPIPRAEIQDLLYLVSEQEGFTPDNGVIEMISQNCSGSARQALALLAAAHSLLMEDAGDVIGVVGSENPPAMALARILLSPPCKWFPLRNALANVEDFESLSVWLARYLCGALAKSNSEKEAIYIGKSITELESVQLRIDKKTALYAAITRIMVEGMK